MNGKLKKVRNVHRKTNLRDSKIIGEEGGE
jgi:hypothetical protein